MDRSPVAAATGLRPADLSGNRANAMVFPMDSPRLPETVVVVPCFNEAQRLDVSAYDDFLGRCSEIVLLLVDDGSTDDTPLVLERLRQLHPRQVCTLRLGANVGKAEAVWRGVQVALRRGPANIGYWDADLATPLDAIPKFCDVLRSRPDVRLVMGSRVALLGRQIRRSGTRHFLGRAFATAASIVLRLPVYDTQCGAKLFRATPAMAELFSRPFRARWIFDVEILARMMAAAAAGGASSVHESIYEYPLERWYDVSGSRLTSHDFLTAVFDLAGIYWRTLRRAKPQAAVVAAAAERSSAIQDPTSSTLQRDAA